MALFSRKPDTARWVRGVPWPSLRTGKKDISAGCVFVPCGTGLIAYHGSDMAYYYIKDHSSIQDDQEHDAQFLLSGIDHLFVKHEDGGQILVTGKDVTRHSVMSVFEDDLWIYLGDMKTYLRVAGWVDIAPIGFAAPEEIEEAGPDLLVRASDGSFLYLHEGISTEDALLTTMDSDIFVHSDSLGLDCAFRDALDQEAGDGMGAAARATEDDALYRNEGEYCLLWRAGREMVDGSIKHYDDGAIIYAPTPQPAYFTLAAEAAPNNGDIASARRIAGGSPVIALRFKDNIYVHVEGEYRTPRLEFGRKEDLLFAIDRERQTMYVFKDFYLFPEDTWQNGDTVRMET